MPVRFKGDSEYDAHYKWLQSPKSATFSPTRQQAAPIAGLSSPQASQTQGFMAEPPILRKKKPIPLVTTSTTKMFDEDIIVPDDYMLLGSQEKFTPNVQYKDYLTKNRTRVLGTTYVAPAKPSEFEEPLQPPQKPLAKINFDTGAPKRPDAMPMKDEALLVTGAAKPVVLSKTRVIAKEPTSSVSPSQSTSSRSDRQRRPDKTVVLRKAPQESAEQQVRSQGVQEPEGRTRPVARQDPNVDNTYAMKYRAGVSPKRVNPKRKTEYEYKYDWKKPVDSTPLLAAQQVVHNRNPQVAPYKVASPKKSEYGKEFKAWKYKPVSQDDITPPKKTLQGSKLRRTRSATDLTPDRRPVAGSPSRIHHDNTRLTRSLNPQKPFFPHRRSASYGYATEYKSNFQPFSQYNYDQGAWKGAAPPHIRQQMVHEPANTVTSSNWTAEVNELREKAEEYRKRSNGTHFSRAHVAQLLSDNSKLWDAVSVSSELSALDLEQSKVSGSPKEKTATQSKPAKRRTQSAQASLRPTKLVNESVQVGQSANAGVRRKLAWSSDGGRSTSPSDSTRSICSESTPTISSTQSAATPVQVKHTKSFQKSQPTSKSSDSTEDGRAQTPELTTSPVSRRHHLDITTPNRHGLLLASPPHRRSLQQGQGSREPGEISKQKVRPRVSDDLQVNIPSPSKPAGQPLISPTYGKPTPDTHPLLNEDIAEPVDEILETRYVQSPQPKALTPRGQGYHRVDRKVDPWNYNVRKGREDDECSQLSNSMMSVISSTSSLASEVLERAAQRQQFWKKVKA